MAAHHARSWEQNYTSHAPQVETKKVIIRKAGWITTGEKILYAIIGVGLIIAASCMVFYASTTDSLNRDLQSLEAKVQSLKVENSGLQYEVKELSKPERIIKKAKENGLTIQHAEVKKATATKPNE